MASVPASFLFCGLTSGITKAAIHETRVNDSAQDRRDSSTYLVFVNLVVYSMSSDWSVLAKKKKKKKKKK